MDEKVQEYFSNHFDEEFHFPTFLIASPDLKLIFSV